MDRSPLGQEASARLPLPLGLDEEDGSFGDPEGGLLRGFEGEPFGGDGAEGSADGGFGAVDTAGGGVDGEVAGGAEGVAAAELDDAFFADGRLGAAAAEGGGGGALAGEPNGERDGGGGDGEDARGEIRFH